MLSGILGQYIGSGNGLLTVQRQAIASTNGIASPVMGVDINS